jgi:hypothetical protein
MSTTVTRSQLIEACRALGIDASMVKSMHITSEAILVEVISQDPDGKALHDHLDNPMFTRSLIRIVE